MPCPLLHYPPPMIEPLLLHRPCAVHQRLVLAVLTVLTVLTVLSDTRAASRGRRARVPCRHSGERRVALTDDVPIPCPQVVLLRLLSLNIAQTRALRPRLILRRPPPHPRRRHRFNASSSATAGHRHTDIQWRGTHGSTIRGSSPLSRRRRLLCAPRILRRRGWCSGRGRGGRRGCGGCGSSGLLCFQSSRHAGLCPAHLDDLHVAPRCTGARVSTASGGDGRRVRLGTTDPPRSANDATAKNTACHTSHSLVVTTTTTTTAASPTGPIGAIGSVAPTAPTGGRGGGGGGGNHITRRGQGTRCRERGPDLGGEAGVATVDVEPEGGVVGDREHLAAGRVCGALFERTRKRKWTRKFSVSLSLNMDVDVDVGVHVNVNVHR